MARARSLFQKPFGQIEKVVFFVGFFNDFHLRAFGWSCSISLSLAQKMYHFGTPILYKSMTKIGQNASPNFNAFWDTISKHLGTLVEPQIGPKIAP